MAAPTLHELQARFFDSIALRPGEHCYSAELTESVAPEPGVDPLTRLGIYADAYWLRLFDVLRSDFPVLARELGEERFASIAREYLISYPSTEPSVRFLGRKFASFLEGRDDLPAYCAAIARLEWAITNAFDAADSSAIDASELCEIVADKWAFLRFAPIHALSLLVEQWPIQKLWSGEEARSLVRQETTICVWRDRDCEVRHVELDAREAEAMKMMLAGETFSGICATYEGLPPDEAAREAGLVLVQWLSRGIIAGFATDPER
jgi:hypothetical protein